MSTPEVLQKLSAFMVDNNLSFVCTAGSECRIAVCRHWHDGGFTDYQFEEEFDADCIRLGSYSVYNSKELNQ
jgi:hypothetical protein